MTKQRQKIAELLETYLDGTRKITEIYDIIVDRLKVPRPTVRREARTLRLIYLERVKIPSQNKNNKTWKKIEDKTEKAWYD